MIIFKVQVPEELKEKIKQTVKGKLHELEEFKPFAILDGERVIIGYGLEGGDVVIEQMVDQVFRSENIEGEQPMKEQGRKVKVNRYPPVERPIVRINPEETFKELLKKNRKIMNMLRNNL